MADVTLPAAVYAVQCMLVEEAIASETPADCAVGLVLGAYIWGC